MQHSSTRRKGNHKYANTQICTPLMTWAHFIGPWSIRGELHGITPPSGRIGWNIQKGFACMVQKTMAEQRFKKIKDVIKKSEELWVFTLYSRKKYKKKQFAALLGLCPHNELQYDCELAEKRAWLFILMDSWNSTRGWMQYDIWCVCYHDLMRGWTDGSPAVKRSD